MHPANLQHQIPSNYRLLRRLGAGATGEVWEAERNGMLVALKILHLYHPQNPALEREYRLLVELNHCNIVRIHGIHFYDHGSSFIEMEMVDGQNLSQYTMESGGVVPWNVLKPLALQLCKALEHAHSKGIIHRDIKPSNLLIDQANKLKLVDFGCAFFSEHFQNEMTRTVDFVTSGTLSFMSPQHINGERPTASDDIYSVGATLHTLLVGAPPFSQGHLVHQILNVKAPLISLHQKRLGVKNSVPIGVIHAIHACLAKNASLRPLSASALHDILDKESFGVISRRKAIISFMGCGLCCAFGSAVHFNIDRRDNAMEPGFEQLFNGTNLDGWSGNCDIWKVIDGAIVARIEATRMPDASNWRKEFLDWQGHVPDNFELRLQVRLTLPVFDAGNLGVRYRISNGPAPVSYDLDFEPIWKYNCGLREIGGRDMLARPAQITRYRGSAGENVSDLLGHLADEKTLKDAYLNDSWNELTIRAEGNRLVHALNGITIVDCTDDDPLFARLQGNIGLKVLLYYGPWVEAHFRHIRIREILPDTHQQ